MSSTCTEQTPNVNSQAICENESTDDLNDRSKDMTSDAPGDITEKALMPADQLENESEDGVVEAVHDHRDDAGDTMESSSDRFRRVSAEQVAMNISPKSSKLRTVEVAPTTAQASVEDNDHESDNDIVTFIPSEEHPDPGGQEAAGRDPEVAGVLDEASPHPERADTYFSEETDLLLAMMLQEEELALHRRVRSFNKPIFAGVHSHEELPVYTIQEDQIVNFEENPECLICLCEYEVGQEVKILPCLHQFHSNCASKWLSESHFCPVCKISIRTGKTQEHRAVVSRQSRNVQVMMNHHERASRTSERYTAEASRERYSTRMVNPRSSTGRNTLSLGNRSLHSTPVRRYLRSPIEGAASANTSSNSSPAQTSRGFMKERFLQLKKFFGR
mmetsp:Transcript_4807/g.17477  ORF Transcript_4807/g.17477 Transcript_4807/m.17477 type:complete len:388 (+) Transcript_4807:139-1302(+)